MVTHLSTVEIEAGMSRVAESPQDGGTVEMIVARPEIEARQVLTAGTFTQEEGLVGDNWQARGSKYTADGRAEPDRQITLMNARLLNLIAGERERWPLAGDQLIVDIDLCRDNLEPGQQLQVGQAVFEVTASPHNGCKKFSQRFGVDAVKFVNSAVGKEQRLRGIYVKVVQPGTVQTGDTIQKI
ncbi:MAG: MOSC domain-containing protein [Chloroflexi bacterium]|nr:MOSC domain-containing protein [Chloroflexota bacterium]